MHSIEMKEIALLKEWAVSHENKNIFDELFLDKQENTYFHDITTDESYIMEYDFNSITELERMFDKNWGSRVDTAVKKMAAVSAFKYEQERRKHRSSGSLRDDQADKNRSRLPEYIYIF